MLYQKDFLNCCFQRIVFLKYLENFIQKNRRLHEQQPRLRREVSAGLMSDVHLLLFITRKYTIINANLKLINVKIHSFYSIDIH